MNYWYSTLALSAKAKDVKAIVAVAAVAVKEINKLISFTHLFDTPQSHCSFCWFCSKLK